MKKLNWIGVSLDTLRQFPVEVSCPIGIALHLVQNGEMPTNAKPFG